MVNIMVTDWERERGITWDDLQTYYRFAKGEIGWTTAERKIGVNKFWKMVNKDLATHNDSGKFYYPPTREAER